MHFLFHETETYQSYAVPSLSRLEEDSFLANAKVIGEIRVDPIKSLSHINFFFVYFLVRSQV